MSDCPEELWYRDTMLRLEYVQLRCLLYKIWSVKDVGVTGEDNVNSGLLISALVDQHHYVQ